MNKDIQDLKRRAGITEVEDPTDQMIRMQQELADNWINGNISDVKRTLHNLDPAMAVAMALRTHIYLIDMVGPQDASNFAKIMINAAR